MKRVLPCLAIPALVFGIQDAAHADIGTPICDRTSQVRDAIVAIARSHEATVNDCNDVTEAHLYEVTTFSSLQKKGVTTLKNGDFRDMPRLLLITLSNNDLTSLPADVFKGLPKFETLGLAHNKLTSIPDDVFEGVTKLKRIVLGSNELSSLDEDVFDGLSLLQVLSLDGNNFASLPEGLFDGLSSLQFLFLNDNDLSSVSEDLFDGLSSLEILSLNNNDLTSLPEDLYEGLTKLRSLYLQRLGLTSVPAELFDGLASLELLRLDQNRLTSLPDGVFEGLTKLEQLNLSFNPVLIDLAVLLEKVADGEFRARVPAGAPFEIVLPVSASNGTIDGGATAITIPKGSVQSSTTLSVTRTAGTTAAVTVDIGDTLPSLPSGHSGYRLVKSADMPLSVIPTTENRAPTFSATTATRTIPENTAAGTNIGTPVSATDLDDGDALTYRLVNPADSTDADAFDIGSTDGQLKTKAALDYETRNSYRFKVQVSDGSATASIEVTVTVTDVDETPQAQEPDSQTTEEETDETDTDSLTASFVDMPASHDGSSAFTFRLTFSEEVTLSFQTIQNGDVLVVGGGSVQSASRRVAGSNLAWGITVAPNSNAAVTVELPGGRACGTTGAVCTREDTPRQLSNSPSATVAGPAADPPLTVPPNTAATGAPTVSGTVQVGQTLSASTSGIADANGLDNVSYSYQWVRSGTDISGETGSTYTLVDADEGETIAVRVSFTDDAGHSESLTSSPTGAVAARPPPLKASFSGVPSEHDGSEFSFTLAFSEAPKLSFRVLKNEALSATGGTVTGAKRRATGSNLSWTITVDPSGNGNVGVTLSGSGACTGTGAVCTQNGRSLSNSPSATVLGPPALSVADAQVDEGAGASVTFTVSLSRSPSASVTVDYATSDGTASAGSDYTSTDGTLTFAAGQRSLTVSVPVLDDGHDEGRETFSLTLSNASGAIIADASATGTIVNSDPMPQAWLARFGRAASTHTLEVIESRWRGGPQESQLTLGGRRMDGLVGRWTSGSTLNGRPDVNRLQDTGVAGSSTLPNTGSGNALAGTSPTLLGAGPRTGEASPTEEGSARYARGSALGLPDLGHGLMGSSFFYSRPVEAEADGERPGPEWRGNWSAWGQTAATRFSGAQGALSLDGEVATATLGVDSQWNRWHAGVALSYSQGEGAYTHREATGGDVSSTLASVNPFARFELSDRTSVWGVLGYGVGEFLLTPNGGATRLDTTLTNAMAAFGGRGVLSIRSGKAGAFELAVRSDAMLTNTVSDAVEGLMGATGATSRVRLVLEGTGSLPLATGGELTPTLEAGLRYDGGDAETGAGIEIGTGLGYSAGRFSVRVNARGLVAHEDTEYEEWGFRGSIRFQPRSDGRGFNASVGSAWGNEQSSVDSLWSRTDASGITRGGASMSMAQRFTTELGYGLEGRKGRALWMPYLGAESGEGTQALRLGAKLTSGTHTEAGLELAQRLNRRGEADYAFELGGSIRW